MVVDELFFSVTGRCGSCSGQGSMPSTTATGRPCFAPCAACKGVGQSTRSVSLAELHAMLRALDEPPAAGKGGST